jgi:SAM-dependent methyltransferase
MSLLERIHGGYVGTRRSRVLSDHFAELIPRNARLLDVGCGDGLLACMIIRKRPDIALRGIDVLVREQTYIPVTAFDGRVIPYADASFDVVMFVDVLHHTADPIILLREAVRVARKALVIKDHTRNGFLAGPTLRLMDWFGNARHGVALPYNYWSQEKWFKAWETLDLTIGVWEKMLGLYPRPAGWLFERSLHFIARLDLKEAKR